MKKKFFGFPITNGEVLQESYLSMKRIRMNLVSCLSLFACCILFVTTSCTKEITQVVEIDLNGGSCSFNGVVLSLNERSFAVGDSLVITVTSKNGTTEGYAFAFIDQECIGCLNEYPCTLKKEMKEAGTFVLTYGYSDSYITSLSSVKVEQSTSINITVR